MAFTFQPTGYFFQPKPLLETNIVLNEITNLYVEFNFLLSKNATNSFLFIQKLKF